MGGGFFTGRYASLEDKVEPGSRFDPEKFQGKVSGIASDHEIETRYCLGANMETRESRESIRVRSMIDGDESAKYVGRSMNTRYDDSS